MLHKALWKQNFRKSGWLVGALIALMWLFTTQPAINNMRNFTPEQLLFRDSEWGWTGLNPSMAGMFIVAFMSVALVSGERNKRELEQFLAFPFKRSDLFWAKWLFGAVSIFGAVLINSVAISISFFQSPLSGFVGFTPFLHYFAFNFLFLLTVFTFGIMVGTLSKSVVSHLFFGAVGMVLLNVIGMFLIGILWGARNHFLVSWLINFWVIDIPNLSLISHLSYSLQLQYINETVHIFFESRSPWALVAYLTLSLLMSYRLFLKNLSRKDIKSS